MSDERKKPTLAFLATVVIVAVLLGYPLSFGPACWWFGEPAPSPHTPWKMTMYVSRSYWPIGWLAQNGPSPLGDAIFSYALLGSDSVMLPTDSAGISWCGKER